MTASVERPTGPPSNLCAIASQQLAVGALEALVVDLEELERLARDLVRDRALVPDLGDVADAAEDPVRDPRRSARAPRDLVGRVVLDLDAEDPAPSGGRSRPSCSAS